MTFVIFWLACGFIEFLWEIWDIYAVKKPLSEIMPSSLADVKLTEEKERLYKWVFTRSSSSYLLATGIIWIDGSFVT